MEKTSTGLEENIAGLLCYVLGWLSGLVFILIEQENRFVRFHAMQSILAFGALTVVAIGLSSLGAIPLIGILFLLLEAPLGILGFILWVVLVVKAYQGQTYKLPWAGDLAERYVG